MAVSELVIALSAVFVTAGVLLLVANQFGLSPIPFYIIAGLIAGRFVEDPAIIELALWGIAFLVFVFGIRLDLGAVQSVLRDAEVAAMSLLIVVAPIAFGVGLAFGHLFGFDDPVRNAIYFSAAATLSSTIVGAGLLEEEIRNNLVHGRLSSSIQFFDDLVAIGLVLILSAEVFTADEISSNIGYGVLFLLAALLIYRHGFPLLVRLANGVDELVLMGSISVLIAFIAAAEYLEISIVVAAFAAGIAVRTDGSQTLSVRNGIESIRDFFVAIFFVTVGALVSVPTLQTIAIALVLVVLVVVVNPLILMAAFSYEGYDDRTAFLTGSSLNQVSEFSLVIAIQALVLGTIAETLFDAVILAAATTMILTSITSANLDRVYDSLVKHVAAGRQTRKIDQRSFVEPGLEAHVIVLGYGRQGRQIVATLEKLGRPYVVIENDPVMWDDLRTNCRNYVLGDAMADYPWEKARVEEAALVVSTVGQRRVSNQVLERAGDIDCILRAATSQGAVELLDAGATYVAVPNVLAGDQLIETIEAVIDGDVEESIRNAHLDQLAALGRLGVTSRR